MGEGTRFYISKKTHRDINTAYTPRTEGPRKIALGLPSVTQHMKNMHKYGGNTFQSIPRSSKFPRELVKFHPMHSEHIKQDIATMK